MSSTKEAALPLFRFFSFLAAGCGEIFALGAFPLCEWIDKAAFFVDNKR
jgi:hypothetical protein